MDIVPSAQSIAATSRRSRLRRTWATADGSEEACVDCKMGMALQVESTGFKVGGHGFSKVDGTVSKRLKSGRGTASAVPNSRNEKWALAHGSGSPRNGFGIATYRCHRNRFEGARLQPEVAPAAPFLLELRRRLCGYGAAVSEACDVKVGAPQSWQGFADPPSGSRTPG